MSIPEDATQWLIGLAESRAKYAPHAAAVLAELERRGTIERNVIEWRNDTDLTHPSTSERAIHDAMHDVLDRNAS
jgi:hypothetical protein